MKFDGGQGIAPLKLGHKTDSKPFEFSDGAFNSTELKSEKNTVQEFHKEANGVNPASKHDRSMSLNDLTNNTHKDIRFQAAPYSRSSRETEPLVDSLFFMDKSVTEHEVPEVIVSYKENTCHVKDICVDEGVQSQNKTMIREDGNLEEEKYNIVLSPPDALKGIEEECSKKGVVVNQCDSSTEENTDKDDVHQRDSKELLATGEINNDASDSITTDISKELMSLGDLLSIGKSTTENSFFKSTDNNIVEVEKESFQGSGEKEVIGSPILDSTIEASSTGTGEARLASSNLISKANQSNNIYSEEAILGNPPPVSSAEEKHEKEEATSTSPDLQSASAESAKTNNDDKPYKSNLETGNVTLTSDASVPVTRDGEDIPQSGDSEHVEIPDTSRIKDGTSQSVSNHVQGGVDDPGLSVSGPLPGLINYSGPIAFSGSLSIRSDSSTTSARSFAFPVLQSEWNSSPVRMVKPDRRHLRKNKWRQGLLCCRF